MKRALMWILSKISRAKEKRRAVSLLGEVYYPFPPYLVFKKAKHKEKEHGG